MIDKAWMNAYAEKVTRCPKCRQKSFCLVFQGETSSVWECADTKCFYIEH